MATGIVSLCITGIAIAKNVSDLIITVKGFKKRTQELENNISTIKILLEKLSEVPQTNSSRDEVCRVTVEELQSCMNAIQDFLHGLAEKKNYEKFGKSSSIERKFDTFNDKLRVKIIFLQTELQVEILRAVTEKQVIGTEDVDAVQQLNASEQTSENSEGTPTEEAARMNVPVENLDDNRIPMEHGEPEPEAVLSLRSNEFTDVQQRSGLGNSVPTPEFLSKISDAITEEEDVGNLGRALHVPRELIERAKDDNNGGLDSRGTLKMLQTWVGSRTMDELQALLTDSQLIYKFPDLFPGAKKSLGAYGGGEFYDIFLLTDGIAAHENKIKEIARINDWKVMTRGNLKLGEPVMESLENVLESSSYVVVLVTEKNAAMSERKLTIEMSFQGIFDSPYKKIIPILCCDEKVAPTRLKSMTGGAIDDPSLKTLLEEVISTRHRRDRERAFGIQS